MWIEPVKSTRPPWLLGLALCVSTGYFASSRAPAPTVDACSGGTLTGIMLDVRLRRDLEKALKALDRAREAVMVAETAMTMTRARAATRGDLGAVLATDP